MVAPTDAARCVHHYILPFPEGPPPVVGTCKKCGSRRAFKGDDGEVKNWQTPGEGLHNITGKFKRRGTKKGSGPAKPDPKC